MKKLFSIIICINILSMLNVVTAQNSNERCTTMEALQERLDTDPKYAQYHEWANSMPTEARVGQIPCDAANTIVVPVAFHFAPGVVTCGDATCLLTEVQDQLDAMNLAFGDNTGTAAEAVCPSAYQDAQGNSVASTGTCISFCLAIPPEDNDQGLDPACDPPITIGEFTGGLNAGGNGAPGWGGIMNLFIVSNANCLGVADGIPGAGNGDGVSTCATAFGGFGGSAGCGLDNEGTYNLGATMVHEIGHYLGLFHTHVDGAPSCTDNDVNAPGPFNVNDTPIMANQFYGCPTGCVTNTSQGTGGTCGATNVPTANFMAYTDDACMTMFTEDQAAVMNYWANQLFGTSDSQCSAPSPTELPNACLNQPCVLACPTVVTAPLAITDDFCGTGSGAFPADPTVVGLVLDDDSDAVYTWSTGNYTSAGGAVVAAPTALTSAGCAVETETYFLNVDCGTTPLTTTLDGGTYVVTVYPAPPADITTLVTITGEDGCAEPVVTPIAGCEAYVTVVGDAANPAFPVAAGVSGTADYTVTFVSNPAGPECCVIGNPDDEGEIIVNGDFTAGTASWVETEESPPGTATTFGVIGVSGGFVNGAGDNDAWFGGWGANGSFITLTQDITIPNCSAVNLTFNYGSINCSGPTNTVVDVIIGGVTVGTINCNDDAPPTTFGPIDVIGLGVTPGVTTIVFEGTEMPDAATGSILLDDVSLVASACTSAADCDVVVTADYDCVTTGVPYCDDPCFVEYNPAPGADDIADAAECVTALDCANGASTAQVCDDGDPCTENDMESVLDCDAAVICVPCAGTPIATCTLPSVAQACDDGDPCTENDMEEVDACDAAVVCVPCAGTAVAACAGTPNMVACDDGDPCTSGEMEGIDACDGVTVCVPCGNGMVVAPACGDPTATNYDMNATCIDNTLCTYGEYCDNPCFAEYTPNPGMSDIPNSALCVIPLGCADLADIDPACITTQACDDGDPCTENEEETLIIATNEVCGDCGLNSTVVAAACGDPTANNYDMNATCIDNNLCTYDSFTIEISDPCACGADENEDTDGDGIDDLVADEITITGPAGSSWCLTANPAPVAEDITGTVYPADGTVCAVEDPANPGSYTLTVYHSADGAGYGPVTFTDQDGNELMIGNATGCDCICEDAIFGSIFTDDPMCAASVVDFSGISVTIIDNATGLPVATTTTDVMGNYALAGPFPCGEYTAELDPITLPTCYADLEGEVGPIPFIVNGDDIADGANFSNIIQVPTLSQWGLISLALLLMIFGAVKISATSGRLNSVRK